MDEPCRLEILQQFVKSPFIEYRSDDDQVSFDAKLQVSQSKSFVDHCTFHPGALKRGSSDDQAGIVRRQFEWHR